MKNQLNITKLIQANPSKWREILSVKPYCFKINENEHYFSLVYDMIETDMNLPESRECRGIIFDKETLEPVCVPFFKFYNHGESKADKIDWTTARVMDKVDGSLIKIWFSDKLDKWMISTNGTVDAFSAGLMDNPYFETFGQLVMHCFEKNGVTPEQVLKDRGLVYMFELTSLFNKVVITYGEPSLTFLGVRDMMTYAEAPAFDLVVDGKVVIPAVKSFPLKTLDDVLRCAEAYHGEAEGFVVCDANYNRVKIKSAFYVKLHHAKDNQFTYDNAIKIVMKGEVEEFLAYFPEYKPMMDFVQEKFDGIVAECFQTKEYLDSIPLDTPRKDIAIHINKTWPRVSFFGFAYLDAKLNGNTWDIDAVISFLKNRDLTKLIK